MFHLKSSPIPKSSRHTSSPSLLGNRIQKMLNLILKRVYILPRETKHLSCDSKDRPEGLTLLVREKTRQTFLES